MKAPDSLSWHQPHLRRSLELIAEAGLKAGMEAAKVGVAESEIQAVAEKCCRPPA